MGYIDRDISFDMWIFLEEDHACAQVLEILDEFSGECDAGGPVVDLENAFARDYKSDFKAETKPNPPATLHSCLLWDII